MIVRDDGRCSFKHCPLSFVGASILDRVWPLGSMGYMGYWLCALWAIFCMPSLILEWNTGVGSERHVFCFYICLIGRIESEVLHE